LDILKEGENCWKVEYADRASFLIDADVYFRSLVSAVNQAERTVYISAWDIDSRINLIRSESDVSEVRLGAYLDQKARSTPGLEIYILCWDSSVIYALERELLGPVKLGWKTHERVHFHLDKEHPAAAAHHQKFVVVDDTLAFCGGIDLTKNRWDSPRHKSDDPKRANPEGTEYEPFHDIQMAVEGSPAASLGELFRLRWLWSTGVHLEPVKRQHPLLWPQMASPHMTHARIGIARTYPAYKGRQEIREIEALYLDAIESARRVIYCENQYFTSPIIADALIRRLEQPRGPEIVLVLPEKSRGLLEQSTMDALRAGQMQRILKADIHNRLRVVMPVLEEGNSLFVHAKVMVVDDRLARVGSSNLTNRSLGLDTECDLAVEGSDDAQIRKEIILFRNQLIAEHTGKTREEVDRVCRTASSFLKALDALGGPGRRFEKLDTVEELPIDGTKMLPDTSLLDPDHPGTIDKILDGFVDNEGKHSRNIARIKGVVLLTVLLGLAAAWRWTPLSQWIEPQQLADWGHAIRENAFSPFIVMGVYLAAGLLVVPVTVLVGVTAVVFPPLTAFFYSLSGCVLNAILTYGIGAALGRAPLRKVAGLKVERLSKRLAKRGILAIIVIRNFPVAPYTLVNMLAGASKIKFRDYLAGTCIGIAPGIGLVTFFVDRLIDAMRDPGWENIILIGSLVIAFAILIWRVRRRFQKNGEEK
jgi:phospholipase D1/2